MSNLTEPTKFQNDVVEMLLGGAVFEGRLELLGQWKTAKVKNDHCDCGCPSFTIYPSRDSSPAKVKNNPPIEAHYGHNEHYTEILLFVYDGMLERVEFVYYGLGEFPKDIGLKNFDIRINEQDRNSGIIDMPSESGKNANLSIGVGELINISNKLLNQLKQDTNNEVKLSNDYYWTIEDGRYKFEEEPKANGIGSIIDNLQEIRQSVHYNPPILWHDLDALANVLLAISHELGANKNA